MNVNDYKKATGILTAGIVAPILGYGIGRGLGETDKQKDVYGIGGALLGLTSKNLIGTMGLSKLMKKPITKRHVTHIVSSTLPFAGYASGRAIGDTEKEKERYSKIGLNIGLGAYLAPHFLRLGNTAKNYARKEWDGVGRGANSAFSREASNAADLFSKATTKAEAKNMYYDLIRKHHPDKGGSLEKSQAINKAWESFKKSYAFEKLSYLNEGIVKQAFFDELEKVSMNINEIRKVINDLKASGKIIKRSQDTSFNKYKMIVRLNKDPHLSALPNNDNMLIQEISQAFGGVKTNKSSIKNVPDNLKGKIYQGPGGFLKSLKQSGYKYPKNLSPKNKEMINRLGILHEKFELESPSAMLTLTHMHPSVISKENNLVHGLPKKYEGAKNYMKYLRGKTGENFVIKSITGKEYAQKRMSDDRFTDILNKARDSQK